jgi:hypothetical protein
MATDDDEITTEYAFLVGVFCNSEEQVMRAMQALQTATTGLMLDGIKVMFNRMGEEE